MLFKIGSVSKELGDQTFNEWKFKHHSPLGYDMEISVQDNDQT